MRYRHLVATGLLAAVVSGSPAAQSKAAPPRAGAGRSDLQGIWNFSTITPLERPAEFAGKAFLTDAEAAQYEARMAERNNRDNREQNPETDVSSAYNEFWWDRGVHLARVNGRTRTSLIVDPPDGRLPAQTADGRGAAAESRRRTGRPLARRALPAVQRRTADAVGSLQ
jgi:hypothetical protein